MDNATKQIGVICNPGHDVFSVVAQKLRTRGYRVQFFEPGERLEPETIEGVDLLANKKVDPESMRALHYADTHGIATWNGYMTALLGVRAIGYAALRAAGFRVPEYAFEKPEDGSDYVAKTLFDWHFHPDPELNGDGDIFQRFVPADPVDYKYYAVDTGRKRVVRVMRSRSKLRAEKACLDFVDPDPALAEQARTLMDLVDAHAIGVDVIYADGTPYAVDVNPAMSFRHMEMEPSLADSMEACLSRETAAPGVKSLSGTSVPGYSD